MFGEAFGGNCGGKAEDAEGSGVVAGEGDRDGECSLLHLPPELEPAPSKIPATGLAEIRLL